MNPFELNSSLSRTTIVNLKNIKDFKTKDECIRDIVNEQLDLDELNIYNKLEKFFFKFEKAEELNFESAFEIIYFISQLPLNDDNVMEVIDRKLNMLSEQGTSNLHLIGLELEKIAYLRKRFVNWFVYKCDISQSTYFDYLGPTFVGETLYKLLISIDIAKYNHIKLIKYNKDLKFFITNYLFKYDPLYIDMDIVLNRENEAKILIKEFEKISTKVCESDKLLIYYKLVTRLSNKESLNNLINNIPDQYREQLTNKFTLLKTSVKLLCKDKFRVFRYELL